MNVTVFNFIGETVTNATNTFVTPAASNLIGVLQITATVAVTLYLVMQGYAVISGSVQQPLPNFLKQSAKIIIIAALALTADGYTNYVMGALQDLEKGLANALSVGGGQSIYQILDTSLSKGLTIAADCFQQADEAGLNLGSALGWAMSGLIVGLGAIVISALGGAVVIVAKFSLAIVFALGPIFVFALMFPPTAKFFDSWLSQALNYILTIVIMAVIMTFAMKAFDAFVGRAKFDGSTSPILASLEVFGLTAVLGWIILQAGGLASGLAGGVSAAAMTLRDMAAPARMAGGAARSASGAAKGAYNLVNPMTTRRDMQSGMMTTARAANHVIAGNTMWNPAYRQHVMQNMGKNWGRAKGGTVKK